MAQSLIKSMIGYKATDANMQCRGYQFTLGEWHELSKERELVLCDWGFHFCKYPSGVWNYHSEPGTRVFKIEAQEILDAPSEPGADYKLVCYRIKFLEEIKIDGDSNTGNRNTGNSNTGDSNTGYRNTGNSNTGDSNTGDSNTGDSNTGDSNTGDSNTGNRNTGNRNTGDSNTGNRNTGDSNTGYSNTGDGNFGDFHAGFFCQSPEKVICFDVQTKYTRQEFDAKFSNLYYELLDCLFDDAEISYSRFKKLPGITKKKLELLHKKHIEARKEK